MLNPQQDFVSASPGASHSHEPTVAVSGQRFQAQHDPSTVVSSSDADRANALPAQRQGTLFLDTLAAQREIPAHAQQAAVYKTTLPTTAKVVDAATHEVAMAALTQQVAQQKALTATTSLAQAPRDALQTNIVPLTLTNLNFLSSDTAMLVASAANTVSGTATGTHTPDLNAQKKAEELVTSAAHHLAVDDKASTLLHSEQISTQAATTSANAINTDVKLPPLTNLCFGLFRHLFPARHGGFRPQPCYPQPRPCPPPRPYNPCPPAPRPYYGC